MSKELQKDDYLLPGDLGTVTIASTGKVSKVTNMVKNKSDGSVTLTLSQIVDHYLNGVPVTEDADFEIVQPKQIENKSTNL
jgi:hypothetical protein